MLFGRLFVFNTIFMMNYLKPVIKIVNINNLHCGNAVMLQTCGKLILPIQISDLI